MQSVSGPSCLPPARPLQPRVWEGSIPSLSPQLSSIDGVWEGSICSLSPKLSSIDGVWQGSIPSLFPQILSSNGIGKVVLALYCLKCKVSMANGTVVALYCLKY